MEQFQAVNIEQCILGSFIVDNSLGEKLKDLKENMFTVEYNKLILKIMKSLYESKLSLDIESIFIDSHISIFMYKLLRSEII